MARPADQRIEEAIIQLLLPDKSMIYTGLKEAVGVAIGRRTLSFETFQNHLSWLQENHIIIKKADINREKNRVWYSLSEHAIRKTQINILMDNEQREVLKFIYEKILVYDFFKRVYWKLSHPDLYVTNMQRDFLFPDRLVKQIRIKSKTELDSLLSQLNINSHESNWIEVSYGDHSSLKQLLYYTGEDINYLDKLKKRYWKDTDELYIEAEIWSKYFPVPEDFDFQIFRAERWLISRNNKNSYDTSSNLKSRKYYVFVPGVTIQDILNSIDNTPITKDDVVEAFTLLEKFGIIKIRWIGKDCRYVIADTELTDFFAQIKEHFIAELNYLFDRWNFFEEPTNQEIKRMESIFGQKEFKIILNSIYQEYYENKKKMKSCKDVDEYTNMLIQIATENYSLTTAEISLRERLKKYKNQRKESPRTNSQRKKDIIRYNEFLKKEQDIYLEKLPTCCIVHSDLESVKLHFNQVIEKYRFLNDIIDKICPKILEPPNEEYLESLNQV
jgi:DNA-binding transcriptional ArsR family regulator